MHTRCALGTGVQSCDLANGRAEVDRRQAGRRQIRRRMAGRGGTHEALMGALAVMAGDEKPTSVRRQGLSGGFAWQAAFLDRVAGDPASLRRQQQRWLDPAALVGVRAAWIEGAARSEEHTSELQSLMRNS